MIIDLSNQNKFIMCDGVWLDQRYELQIHFEGKQTILSYYDEVDGSLDFIKIINNYADLEKIYNTLTRDIL